MTTTLNSHMEARGIGFRGFPHDQISTPMVAPVGMAGESHVLNLMASISEGPKEDVTPAILGSSECRTNDFIKQHLPDNMDIC